MNRATKLKGWGRGKRGNAWAILAPSESINGAHLKQGAVHPDEVDGRLLIVVLTDVIGLVSVPDDTHRHACTLRVRRGSPCCNKALYRADPDPDPDARTNRVISWSNWDRGRSARA